MNISCIVTNAASIHIHLTIWNAIAGKDTIRQESGVGLSRLSQSGKWEHYNPNKTLASRDFCLDICFLEDSG